MAEDKYLPELMAERDSLDPSFVHGSRLLSAEIEKVQKGEKKEDEKRFLDILTQKNIKLSERCLIPVAQFPKFNFVGKLLGPRGNSLKRLQEDTGTKMSILGKGSMRDKAKEDELRKGGEAKYAHLNSDLHVLVEVFAPPTEAYSRMYHAMEELKKFLIPGYDDGYSEQNYDNYENYYDQAQSDAEYFDYGHGEVQDAYDDYGQEEWNAGRTSRKAPARPLKGMYREHPYGRY
ncbi:KH domain-containing, RNA-binding, signal transduction-associated protein 1-like isoform X3 [Hemitrygon akajei]|uniref:KH domain-containing, RNA-binding, signal transduction-associated protein 1-like isoform X3 n=1 Tax=Hemitrygon akajei TaxID=2704970 RepID=UPI003BF9C631